MVAELMGEMGGEIWRDANSFSRDAIALAKADSQTILVLTSARIYLLTIDGRIIH
jgi:hypothetical protein